MGAGTAATDTVSVTDISQRTGSHRAARSFVTAFPVHGIFSLRPNNAFPVHGIFGLRPNNGFPAHGIFSLWPNNSFPVHGIFSLRPNNGFPAHGIFSLRPNNGFPVHGNIVFIGRECRFRAASDRVLDSKSTRNYRGEAPEQKCRFLLRNGTFLYLAGI